MKTLKELRESEVILDDNLTCIYCNQEFTEDSVPHLAKYDDDGAHFAHQSCKKNQILKERMKGNIRNIVLPTLAQTSNFEHQKEVGYLLKEVLNRLEEL